VKTKIILFVSLIFCARAFANEGLFAKVDLKLPPYETLRKMKKEQLELYILGLRESAKEMEQVHAKEGVKFADAGPAWDFSFLNEAFAASPVTLVCSYGGWPRPRNAEGKCLRPEQGNCRGQNFECPIIYGSVCVGFGNTARASCAASSPPAEEIAARIVGDTAGTQRAKWASYQGQLQSYCDQGAFRTHCQALRARVSEIRTVAGVSDVVAEPAAETYPFGNGEDPIRAARERTPAQNSGAPTAVNTSLNGSSSECYSEVLIQSTSCKGNRNERLAPPEVIFRGFFNEDKEYLDSQIGAIRERAKRQMSCLQDAAKNRAMDKWQRNTVQEQTKMLAGMTKELERCYRYVKGGGKISSAQLGTLTFAHETAGDPQYGLVELSGRGVNGRPPYTTVLQGGYTALSLIMQKSAGRFCDYDLAGYAAPRASLPAPPPAGITTEGTR
jgi:hypothetical protein